MRAISSLLSAFSSLALSTVQASDGTIACNDTSNITCSIFPSCCDQVNGTETTLGPSKAVTASCTNAVQNPSFGSGLDPWTSFASGSWASRDVVEGAAHDGTHFYQGLSNSTNQSTITLSQMNINIAGGAKIDCSAWVYAGGNMGANGNASFEVFVDGASCGKVEVSAGEGEKGWTKVGKEMDVNGDVHMVAIVVTTNSMGQMDTGIEVGIDDVWVGGC